MLGFLEYKTLLVCECVLAIVFAIVFLGMNRIFPQVRGAFPVAMSYALLVPETIFFALGGHVSPVISVLMANTLTLSSMIAMYEGIVQFTGGVSRRWLLWFIAFTSFAVVYFNTEVHPNLAPCVISLAVVMGAIQGFSAFALFKRSMQSTQSKTLLLYGFFLTALGLNSLWLAWTTFAHGVPSDPVALRELQVTIRATEILSMAVSGLCFLVLTSRELVSRRRTDATRDALTGTINRDALELNLALEVERYSRSGQVFSVAMVEVDHLKRVVEAEGRVAANATLREVGAAIAGQLRGTDHVGRFSGDHFLLVLSQTAQQEALIVAARVTAVVGKLKMQAEPVTLSIGITESAPKDSSAELISRAEQALFLAKNEGPNRCLVLTAGQGAAGDTSATRLSALA
jgi:diguanylate cyclase (GGDEF)-like protein